MILSIITINRNNAEGLRKTIESVAEQSFTDFEYIVVDGASMDASVSIISKFKSNNLPQLMWISEPDSGVYEAMNKGIRMANGEYLLFLNSGDFLVNKNVFQEVFSTPHTADFLLGRCNISDKGVIIHTTTPPLQITFGHLYKTGLAHQATFIRREMFLQFGYYREDFKYNSDIEFWYRTIILQCRPTETLSTIISDYNTDGISSKENQSEAYLKEMEIIYSHPLLQLFIPDYEASIATDKEIQILYWVKAKQPLYHLLEYIYKFAHWASNLNKQRVSLNKKLRNRLRNIIRKVYRLWSKPILIFAYHQVSSSFNPPIDCDTDWTSIALFERNLLWLSRRYTFISLTEAIDRLQSNKRRRKKFAVITFDDGYASVQNALSILKSHTVPATIFINTAYLDDAKLSSVNIINYVNGLSAQQELMFPPEFIYAVKNIGSVQNADTYTHYRNTISKYQSLIKLDSSVYLSSEELRNISDPLFSIGLHGHEHLGSTYLSDSEFTENIMLNYNALKEHKNFVPYYAFPFGIADEAKIDIVIKMGYTPFLCNGRINSLDSKAYNRISLDGIDLNTKDL